MNTKTTTVTLILLAAIIVVLNVIVGGMHIMNPRFDFTENKLFTLSKGTKNIIGKIDPAKKVTIRLYVTGDSRVMPQYFQLYAATVEDLLLQLQSVSDGKVEVEKIDVRPNTEEEDKARADDIQPIPAEQFGGRGGDKIYLGLAIQCVGQKEIIPALDPNDEAALEYHVDRSIAKVITTKRPVIGVMSSMPIAGPAMNLPPMMQQQQRQPWMVIQQLRMDYDVREVAMTVEKIDSDIDTLLIVHPGDITEKAQFAIDQFLLRGHDKDGHGGKVIAFVDPQCYFSQQYNQQGQFGMSQPNFSPPTSNLKELFKAWGVGYTTDKVVVDMSYRTPIQQDRESPIFLTIDPNSGINRTQNITSSLSAVQMLMAGSFSMEKKDGINSVRLIESSENSALMDPTGLDKSLRGEPIPNFTAEGRKHLLAVQLSGKFKTAFPDGPPVEKTPKEKAPKLPGDTGGETKDAGAPVSSQPAPAASPPAPPVPVTPAPIAPAPATPAISPPQAASAPPKPDKPAPVTTLPITVTTPPVSAADAKPKITPPPVTQLTPAPKGAVPPPTPAASTPIAAAPAKPKADFIKESQNGDGLVLLFSDADMLFDALCFRKTMLGVEFANSNVALLMNSVEMATGGTDLIEVRSRGASKRPFTKMKEMSEQVEAQYRPKIQALAKEQETIAEKLRTVKVARDKNGQLVVVDPEQRKAIQDLQGKQKKIDAEKRSVEKQQSRGKDQLEMWITLINFLLMPIVVIAAGILFSLNRSTARAAR